VTIGNNEPITTASETKPLVVATPSSRFPKKSAAPIPINTGMSFLEKPPVVLYFANNSSEIIKVENRIVVIVIIALDFEPTAINEIAPPKPRAAITA
jgi:hypothetical protein